MKQFILSTGLVLSVIAPLSASAAPIRATAFDKMTNLHARIQDGSVYPLVRAHQTMIDPVTHKPIVFDEAVHANIRELLRWDRAFLCESKLDVSKCFTERPLN